MRIAYLIAICFCSIVVCAEPPQLELKVENFFSRPNFDAIRISPTGEYIAARANIGGNKELVILDSKSNKVIFTFHFGDGEREVGDFGWLNDKRIYASMFQKVGPLEQPRPTGFLFAGDIDGKKLRQLLPTPARAGKSTDMPKGFAIANKLKDDPENILVQLVEPGSGKSRLVKLNVYSGRQQLITSSPYDSSRFVLDHQGNPRVLVSENNENNEQTTYYKDNDAVDWVQFDTRNVKYDQFIPLAFHPSNDQIYVYINESDTPQGLYLINIKTKARTLVFEHKNGRDVESYIEDDETKLLVGLVTQNGRLSKNYFQMNKEIVETYKNLDAAFPNSFVEIENQTDDNSLMVIKVIDDKNLGSFYLFDRKSGQVAYLLDIKPELPPELLSDRKPIEIIARDGVSLDGYITLPKNKKTNLPLIVLIHGGPYGVKDEWKLANYNSLEAQFFAYHGYAVAQVNYRGSGGKGSRFILDNYRKVAKEMQDDVTDLTLWAIKEGIASKDKICIYGASYGAYSALVGVEKEPDLYKCAAALSGVYNIDIQREKSDTRFYSLGREFLDLAWNAYDKEFVYERSPVNHVKKIKAALFIAHGTNDRRTPFENFQEITKTLDENKIQYSSMVKEGEGHGFYLEKNQVDFYTALLEFFNKNIGY